MQKNSTVKTFSTITHVFFLRYFQALRRKPKMIKKC